MQKIMIGPNNQLLRKDTNILECCDVYFTHKYAQLYEEIEEGVAQTVYFASDAGKMEYTFIKREVPFKVDGKQYYDITTAYGYGGPCICGCTDCIDAKNLLADFNATFSEYCLENDIVSEFIRFHLFENKKVQEYFTGEISLMGSHIARDLSLPMTENFDRTVRATVRKAEKNGVEIVFDETGEYLEDFLSVYYETMDRSCASDFYYFSEKFFRQLNQTLKGEIVYAHAYLDGKPIGSYSCIYGDQYAYGFLGGTVREYMKYGTSTFLHYNLMKWAKEKGLKYFTMGGGYKGEDGLYKYKTKFDKEGIYPFYIGKQNHNPEIYKKLVEHKKNTGEFNPESEFFPLYRS